MPKPRPIVAGGVLALLTATPAPLLAQSPAPDAPPVSFSAYFQPQYVHMDGTDSDARDRVFFRRLVLTAEAKPFRGWAAEAEVDLAPVTEGDRAIVKDAFLRYTGWEDRGWTLTLGNQKTPFARSVLQSSSRRGLVERPSTGEKVLGAPGRALSLRVDGRAAGERLYVGAALASALRAPSSEALYIDGLAEARDDWNDGVLASGRVEWHPRGRMSPDHGVWTPDEPARFVVAAAAYAWRNDGDQNLHPEGTVEAVDVDTINGLEIGGGVRAGRLSIDGELQRFTTSAIAPDFTGGLYANGRGVLRKAAIEGGWMLHVRRLEILASADVADADTYGRAWRRGAFGMNWYVHGHDLKFQIMYRRSWNADGVPGARTDAMHAQAQIAF